MATNKTQHRRIKNKIAKTNLVFDEEKRREYLTGFHKRKLLRKKKGQEKLENELKEERKRLKIKAKESYKKLFLSNRKIPELENTYDKVYDDDNVIVEVKELANTLHNNMTSIVPSKYNKSEVDTLKCTYQECNTIPNKGEVKQQRKQNETSDNSSDKQPFTSKKGLKKELRKMATKNLQNSKVFKKKNRVEKLKQKKKAVKQKIVKNNQQRKRRKI